MSTDLTPEAMATAYVATVLARRTAQDVLDHIEALGPDARPTIVYEINETVNGGEIDGLADWLTYQTAADLSELMLCAAMDYDLPAVPFA